MTRFVTRLCVGALVLAASVHSFADDMAQGSSDDQLASLGTRFAAALNDGDAEAVNGLFDLQALGARVAATLTDNPTERAEYVRGFAIGAKKVGSQFVDMLQAQQGRAKYLRVRTFNAMRGPLVRYDLGESGYNYALLISEPGPGGEPRIVDMFVATNGQRISETLGAVSQLMVMPSPSLLEKLFGRVVVDEALAGTLKAAGELQRRGDFAGAYDRLSTLPEAVRNHRAILNLSVQIAGAVSEEDYRAELGRLAANHGDDPTAAFLLIDYYFYEGDAAAAMAVMDGVERAWGADAAIMLLKANIAATGGDPDAALGYARRGVELEPDNEAAYWTLVTAFMGKRDYAEGIRVLETLEEQFGYVFEPANFEGNEIYAGFVESREFANWSRNR
jgi:hypothetical protein